MNGQMAGGTDRLDLGRAGADFVGGRDRDRVRGVGADQGVDVEGLAGWSEVLLIAAAVACLLFALGGVALS